MDQKTVSAFVIIVVCFGVGFAQNADCGFRTSPCMAYAEAEAVFVGRVTKISPQTIEIWQRARDYDQIAHVAIEKSYKGLKRSTLVLHQLGRKNAPKFISGERYLFYASFDRATKKWEVKHCGRTHMARYLRNDLRYLEGLPASLNTTRIAGEVTRYEADKEEPQSRTQKIAGVRIRIKGEGKEYEAVTDANGVYEFLGIPAGKYLMEPVIPAGLALMLTLHTGPSALSTHRSLNLELKENGCYDLDLILTPNRTTKEKLIGRSRNNSEGTRKSQRSASVPSVSSDFY